MKFILTPVTPGSFTMHHRILLVLVLILPLFATENIKSISGVAKANVKAVGPVAEANIKAVGEVDNTAAGGAVQVTINAIGTPTVGVGTTLTIPVTITLASNGYAWVGCGGWDSTAGNTIISATFDGVAMAGLIASTASADTSADFRMFGLAIGNKAAGTYNAVITYAVSYDETAGDVIVCNGVHQTVSTGTANTAIGTSTAPSVTVASVTATGLLLDTVVYSGGTTTAGANQTERWDATDGGGLEDSVGSTQDGGDGGVMSWTLGTSQPWGIGAVELKSVSP